jgi:hypothetical protein
MIKIVLPVLAVAATVNACARPATTQTTVVMDTLYCPSQRPASWAQSQFRVALGYADPSLDAGSGALMVDVQVDSMPGVHGAQVSLSSQTIRRDAAFSDSLIKITVPAGRYFLRARRIDAQTLQDSIDVRSGFVDTVKVILGRQIVCLDATTRTK